MIKCPVPGGFSHCPYCDSGRFCTLENPREECDGYCYYTEGDDEEE